MDYIPSADCTHSKNGLCSKCLLKQSFGISRAEEIQQAKRLKAVFSTPEDVVTREPQRTGLASSSANGPSSISGKDAKDNSDSAYVSFGDIEEKFEAMRVEEDACSTNGEESCVVTKPMPEPESWTKRLINSPHFSPSIAVQLLFKEADKTLLNLLGSKLDSFPKADIEFYLPQLIYMYMNDKDVASAIHPYIVTRCQDSVHFSLLCLWLLESLAVDRLRMRDKTIGHGEMLRQMVVNEFRAPKPPQVKELNRSIGVGEQGCVRGGAVLCADSLDNGVHLTRSASAASTLGFLSPANLSSSRSLATGCRCIDDGLNECRCQALRLGPEKEFVSWLTRIGERLKEEPNKIEKTRRLVSELLILNMQLPARVWIPFAADHIVLRIPQTNSCVLNSKDKAPYCIYVEVLRCTDVMRVKIPKSVSEANNELHQRLSIMRSTSMASLSRDRCDSPSSAGTLTDEGREFFDKDSSASNEPDNERTPPTLVEFSTDEIPIVQCNDIIDPVPYDTTFDQGVDPAWDTMSLESSASEPAMRGLSGITGQAEELSRRFKQWVKRPGHRRQMRHHPDDPSASTLSEPFEEKRERIRQASPYGRLEGWDLLPVIVKSGDDLAQEMLAYQLLVALQDIWKDENVPLVLRPYRIIVTSANSGMIEPIVDACSLHQIKRNQIAVNLEEGKTTTPTLEDYFVEVFGAKGSTNYVNAQANFVRSCAAYSLVCYFLQVKDRHNGNILLDADGHVIHIDFGFILSISPKNLGFETSPFKLTTELLQVMGGTDSDMFLYFKTLLLRGIMAARKHSERVMTLLRIMCKGSRLQCFRSGELTLKAIEDRFHVTYTDEQLHDLVDSLIETSRDSLTTRLYDNFQYYTNGIM